VSPHFRKRQLTAVYHRFNRLFLMPFEVARGVLYAKCSQALVVLYKYLKYDNNVRVSVYGLGWLGIEGGQFARGQFSKFV